MNSQQSMKLSLSSLGKGAAAAIQVALPLCPKVAVVTGKIMGMVEPEGVL